MISIIDRYIGKEILKSLAGVAIVLYLIFLSNKIVSYLADVASGDLPGSYLFVIIALASIRYLIILTPLAFYIAILLLFGRLYRDHEMASMFACGVGTSQLYRPVFMVAVPLSLLIMVLSFIVVPWASNIEAQLYKDFAKNLEFTGISPGKFHSSGNRIIYLEEMSEDHTYMSKVFIQTTYKERNIVMVAEKAHLEVDPGTSDRLLVLENGSRYEGVPGETDFRQLKFSRHSLLVPPTRKTIQPSSVESMTFQQLLDLNSIKAWTELQWRLSIPVAVILLSFLAVPLSRIQPRHGQFGKLFVGILLYVVYVNLIAVSKAWMIKETLPLSVGMTWVHLMMLLLALTVLLRQHGWKWVREQYWRWGRS